MTGKTHLAAGICAGLAAAAAGCGAGAAVGIIAGSVLPDIDSPRSLVGRYVPAIPKLIPHRTFTHSLLFAGLCAFFSPWLSAGVLLHMLLDSATPKGIKPLWPLRLKFRMPLVWHLFHHGSPADRVVRLVCIAGALLFGICLLTAHYPAAMAAEKAAGTFFRWAGGKLQEMRTAAAVQTAAWHLGIVWGR